MSRLQSAAADNPAQRGQVDLSKVQIVLYKLPPAGFSKALEIGEALAKGDQQSNDLLQL